MGLQAESAAKAFPGREIAPPSHQRWAKETEDGFAALEERFREWGALAEKNEELFQRHVYKNEDAFDGDFRQHRLSLCEMMGMGEEIAYDFLAFVAKNPETDQEIQVAALSYVKIMDQKLASLRATLFQWHGDIEAQVDLPESLKEGCREVKAGKIEDWEDL